MRLLRLRLSLRVRSLCDEICILLLSLWSKIGKKQILHFPRNEEDEREELFDTHMSEKPEEPPPSGDGTNNNNNNNSNNIASGVPMRSNLPPPNNNSNNVMMMSGMMMPMMMGGAPPPNAGAGMMMMNPMMMQPPPVAGQMMPMMMQPPVGMMPMMRGGPMMAAAAAAPAGAAAATGIPPPPTAGGGPTWTEHDAPDGRKYYYNQVTKKSTYEKPRELYTARENFVFDNCSWKATYDKTSEKYYYYNRETKKTQWEKPEELTRTEEKWERLCEEKTRREGGGAGANREEMKVPVPSSSTGLPPIRQQQQTHNQSYVPLQTNSETALTFANDEERKAAFNKLLDDINMPTSGTFEQFAQLAASDARFNALKKNGEKRNLFNGFRSRKLKAEKEEMKEVEKRKRVAFRNGLQDCRVKYDITSKSRIIRDSPLERNLMSQTWFTNIESLKEREHLFREFCSGLHVIERNEKFAKKEQSRELFKGLLLEKGCNFNWQWRRDVMNNPAIQNDTRAVHCDRQDQLTVFSELFRSFDQNEIETMNRENAVRFREERKNRERFCETLKELVENKILTPRTLWKKFKTEKLESTASFGMCNGNVSGSTPRELFDDEVMKLEEVVMEDAKRLEAFIKENASKSPFPGFQNESIVDLLDESAMATASSGNKLPPFDDIVKYLEEYVESNKAALLPSKQSVFVCEAVADTIERIHRRKKRKLRDALDDFEDYLYDEMKLFDEVLNDKTYSETKKAFQSSAWWTKCSKEFNVSDEKLEEIFEDVKKDRLRKLAKKQSGSSGRGYSSRDDSSRKRSRDGDRDIRMAEKRSKQRRAHESPENESSESGELK